MINALTIDRVFNAGPLIETKGCHFHFCQLIMKNAKKNEFNQWYIHNVCFQKFFKHLMCLGFLRIDRVKIIFDALVENIRADIEIFLPGMFDLLTAETKLNKFVDYCEKTWMKEDALFPPIKWNLYNLIDYHRTNNICEASNARANLLFGPHPTLWKFIRLLKKMQLDDANEQLMIHVGHETRKRRKSDISFDTRLVTLKERYDNNELNDFQFVVLVAAVKDSCFRKAVDYHYNDNDDNEVDED
jgi:hypothetical protein